MGRTQAMKNRELKYLSLTKDSRLGMYIPVPIPLLTCGFSSTTLLIYASILNRALLSQRNDWKNNNGEIYIRFSIEELARFVGKGHSTVKASLKELEESGLIHRKRTDLYTTLIYVNAPESCLMNRNNDFLKPESNPCKVEKFGLQTAEKVTTNNKSKLHDLYTDRYTYEEVV